MSVAIGRAIRDGLRAHGVTVHESPGPGVQVNRPGSWEARGNGLTSRYKGLVVHHTAGNFGRDYSTLYNGRSDLPGPLCNTSGNEDGSVTMIAAHPGNHAGASGGWDTAPLPRTSLFNPEVWGHEICYPGTVPMRDAQWRTAAILGRVVCDVLRVPESHIKFHNGTSITGKWDAGYGNGKTYNIADLRRAAQAVRQGQKSPTAGKEDAMILLNGSGGGPFGCWRVGLCSGGIFSWMNQAAHKKSVEDAVNLRMFPAIWVDDEAWNEIDRQSKQLRDVGPDGFTRRAAPDPVA